MTVDPTGSAPRRKGVRVRVVAVVVVVLALVAGGAAFAFGRGTAAARVTASSAAPGSDLQSLVGGTPGAGHWRSADTDPNPTVTVGLSAEQKVDRVEVGAPSAGTGLQRGHLEFSDGSAVAFGAAGRKGVVVTFPSRSSSFVRIVADSFRRGSAHVEYTSISIRDDPRVAVAPAGRADEVAVSSGHRSEPADGTADLQDWRPAADDQHPWARLTWRSDREVHLLSVRARNGDATFTGSVTFSDGSRLDLGRVSASKWSTTAFMPRVTRSLTISATSGSPSIGAVTLSPVADDDRAPDAVPAGASGTAPAPCPSPASTSASGGVGLTVLCPTPGTAVSGELVVRAQTAPGATVTARAWEPRIDAMNDVGSDVADATGLALVPVRTDRLLRGPLNVALAAQGGGVRASATVQVVNESGVDLPGRSFAPKGMDEVFSDDFDGAPSVSLSGDSTTYAAVKPSADGATQFGDAPFADPASSPDAIVGTPPGYLRLQLSTGDSAASAKEGALVSSYSTSGTGFAALDGYFEARILGGPGAGAWPAFWMLSAGSAYTPRTAVSEVDAMELYGRDAGSACHATHNYLPGKPDAAAVDCVGLAAPSDDWSLAWHTYATRITAGEATFFIDGKEVGRAPRTAAQQQSMFFMLNLAAGGGWPVDLAPTSGRSQMYVDWVKIFV